MAKTLIELDSQRQYVFEPPYSRHVSSADIAVNDSTSARLKKWQGTGTITLAPVNLSTNFHETADFERTKFRLSDCYYDKDWWGEVSISNATTGDYDFFFNAKVKNSNALQVDFGGSWPLLGKLNILENIALQAVADAQTLQTLNSVGVIVSQDSLPANQGYYLRFRIDDIPAVQRAAIIDFVFGDFWLRINGDGTANLFQTLDFNSWQPWETFRWHDGNVHGSWHRIAIFPHARDKIEFLAQSPMLSHEIDPVIARAVAEGVSVTSLPDVLTTSHVFKSRASTKQSDGSYVITQGGRWALYAHRQFRPFVQVSRLAFYDGAESPAYVFDAPHDIGYAPKLPIEGDANYDLPSGCELTIALQAPDVDSVGNTLAGAHRFVQGKDSAYIFTAQMKGDGAIPGNFSVPSSSTTPELYDYSLDKGVGIDTDSGASPETFEVLSVSIDHGSKPGTDTLDIALDNSDGALDAYVRRAHLPCRLFDRDTGLTLFEGICRKIEYSKCGAQEPKTLRLKVKGMADTLQRHFPTDLDFTMGTNSNGSAGEPWRWQAAVLRSFQSAGYLPSQVLIEGTDKKNDGSFLHQAASYDFPLWAEAATGSGTDPTAATGRWRPNPSKPTIIWLNFLLQDVLGWHYVWRRSEPRKWTIFKRPSYKQAINLPVAAAFFENEDDLFTYQQAHPDIPSYLHAGLRENAVPAEATTIDAWGAFPRYVMASRAELHKILQNPVNEGDAGQAVLRPDNSVARFRFDNPAGYQTVNGPEVDRNSPDFLRTQTVREVNLTQAPSRTAFQWLGRRIFEDLCFGKIESAFTSDWGDEGTCFLRKWDHVIIDFEHFTIDRVEPIWGSGEDQTPDGSENRRARYTANLLRPNAALPR